MAVEAEAPADAEMTQTLPHFTRNVMYHRVDYLGPCIDGVHGWTEEYLDEKIHGVDRIASVVQQVQDLAAVGWDIVRFEANNEHVTCTPSALRNSIN